MNLNPEDMRDLFAPQLEQATRLAGIMNQCEDAAGEDMCRSFVDIIHKRDARWSTVMYALATLLAYFLDNTQPDRRSEAQCDVEALTEFIRGEA